MIEGKAGRRYARALFEIALEENAVDRMGEELGAIALALAESPELRQLLVFPTNTATLRKQVFDGIASRLGVGDTVRNFVRLLIDRNRMAAFDAALLAYHDFADAHLGQVRGEVVSAKPLTDEQLAAVQAKLEKISGKRVLLAVREDPALIGGLVARVGTTLYDSSIRTRLEGLKRVMSDSAHH